ncbi:hypothetical protein GQ53DRAFT_782257 [Thozetella sp. PMI_491]|nr:hypothetical protein GQ53DRAFT_782257 [Thozetella sp. PMI_491]
MGPRRSHKKSRAGCRRCKGRKIKCDEVHPRCGPCMKHGVPCDFEHPELVDEPLVPQPGSANSPGTSSVTPLYRPPAYAAVSSATPPRNRLLELKLMHQYTAMTCKTFTFTAPVTEEIWKHTVPTLAFSGSQHLADAILAVAALHLRSLQPNDKEIVRASHAYMAASLAEYSATLTKGIDNNNAESLFLTSALIAFQSTATRVFMKDELSTTLNNSINGDSGSSRTTGAGGYAIPFSWFHAFQGVKAITASSWQWLRQSHVVTQVINSQAVLQLDFTAYQGTFFGHLLDGLEEEIASLDVGRDSHHPSQAETFGFEVPPLPGQAHEAPGMPRDQATQTRIAYLHAVAVLNWAHKIPHKGAPLTFPATVSRRYIELLQEGRPRALAILACFFALLKSLDSIWWVHGMARREVLGVVSLFNSDFLGPEAYREWWPHLEWATRIALYNDDGGVIPAEIWGSDWLAEEQALAQGNSDMFGHIEMLSHVLSPLQPLPLRGRQGPKEGTQSLRLVYELARKSQHRSA